MDIQAGNYYRLENGEKAYIGYCLADYSWVGHIVNTLEPTTWDKNGTHYCRDGYDIVSVWKEQTVHYVNSWVQEHPTIESARKDAESRKGFLGCFKCVYEDGVFISAELVFTK